MTKFKFEPTNYPAKSRYAVSTLGGNLLGAVRRDDDGTWRAVGLFGTRYVNEGGYRTRNAAAERLLLVACVTPVAKAALPDDPFEGVSA